MKTVEIHVSEADYDWLKAQAEPRKMTIAQIVEDIVSDASALDAKAKGSVEHLQAFVKEPSAFTHEHEEVVLLERIIMTAREGKVIP